jgi:uncharacterized protein (DUF885 family)
MVSLMLVSCSTAAPTRPDAAARVTAVADEYYAAVLNEMPEQAYFAGVALERHDGLSDKSPAWLAGWQKREDAWLAALDAIDAGALIGKPEWVTHGVLRESLAAWKDARVCHGEWWMGVNQLGSWDTDLATLAERQPVDSPVLRSQALARWSRVPGSIRQEIANLRTGLAHGYSMTRPVAELMLMRIDGLLPPVGGSLAEHPYASPAFRTTDEGFRAQYLAALERDVLPALREYRTFLSEEYLPKARTTLAVGALPQGAACYEALLRVNTTLRRTPEQLYALGQKVVAANMDDVRAIGRRVFGTDDAATIIRKVKEAPDNQYKDQKDLLPDSRAMVERAHAAMSNLFVAVPTQPVIVEPLPEYRDRAGAGNEYEVPAAGRPGRYLVSLLRPGGTSRAMAEIVVFHETWPGHHLQAAYAQRVKGLHPVTQLIENSAYIEGWARYGEQLAEEAGLYRTDYAKVLRRARGARGMVVDPGIHAMGWTRDQAVAFLIEGGLFDEKSAPRAVASIAGSPGFRPSYDLGAQEFLAIRREAEAALGARFDLRQFNDALLDHGAITLPMLRSRMQRWIAGERAQLAAKH